MIEKKKQEVNKMQEVIEFYNRYLALDHDEAFIQIMVNIFAKKVIEKARTGEKDLKCTLNDLENPTDFTKSCLNFWMEARIQILGGYPIIIDRFGFITSIHPDIYENFKDYIGKSVFQLLKEKDSHNRRAEKDAINVLHQNIFASKLFQAIKERIIELNGSDLIDAFVEANFERLEYEDQMKEKNIQIDKSNFGYPRVRSRR